MYPTHFIAPSSQPDRILVQEQIAIWKQSLADIGGDLRVHKPPALLQPGDELNPAYTVRRAETLCQALEASESRFLWSVRGGYGVQALLPYISFERLRQVPPKIVVGFSDICALQAALWQKLRWPSVHGPMLATPYWDGNQDDCMQLTSILAGHYPKEFALDLQPCLRPASACIEGPLLGGNLAVLTSLIGTPWQLLPDRAILFWEDINETPGTLLRWLHQWRQSGLLNGVKALILGRFIDSNDDVRGLDELATKTIIAQNVEFPVYLFRSSVGHCRPNYPLGIGTRARIEDHKLIWSIGDLFYENPTNVML